jgi:hypothetical protein
VYCTNGDCDINVFKLLPIIRSSAVRVTQTAPHKISYCPKTNVLRPSGHYIQRSMVTICTAQWSLYVPSIGHYIHHTVVTMCTAQWSLYVPPTGHYMYHQFNIQQLYVLPTHCIYVFCVDLRTNIHYFPIQH